VRYVLFAAVVIFAAPVFAADVTEAARTQAVDELPKSSFYDTDPASIRGQPGTLFRSEAFTGYELPSEVHATRILYRSRSQADRDTAASAVVIVPTRAAPSGGWPFIVWAQATLGVAPTCAPSLSKQLGAYTQTLVKEGLTRGFAVVAVDYSGLGAGSPREYLWKAANANDIAFAAAAARAAQLQLAAAWVAVGHSEGGLAVWGVAEKMTSLHDSAYRGAMALAPFVDSDTLIGRAAVTLGETYYPVYMAFGIKTVYPVFDIKAMLLPMGVNAYPHLTTRVCRGLVNALSEPPRPGTVLDPRWTVSPLVQRLISSNLVGNKRIQGPLFVGSPDSDDLVSEPGVAARVKALCSSRAAVTYQVYPGDRGTMLLAAFPDQLDWIVDRLRDRPAASSCK
jgi:alpha-beta hydrolase superfamily lysophospholipase